MMHRVPRTRLTAHAVAGQLERVVRHHSVSKRRCLQMLASQAETDTGENPVFGCLAARAAPCRRMHTVCRRSVLGRGTAGLSRTPLFVKGQRLGGDLCLVGGPGNRPIHLLTKLPFRTTFPICPERVPFEGVTRSARALTALVCVMPNVRGEPPAEAGAVRRDADNVHRTCGPPYSACRSGSARPRG
jgi:hypothetical protein